MFYNLMDLMSGLSLKIALLFCGLQLSIYAQKDLEMRYETWWGLMTSTQVSKRAALWNDAHFVNDLFFIYRTGFTWHSPSDLFVTTAGYGYLGLRDPFSENRLRRSEHRPWMQTVYRLPSNNSFRSSFRFRYDARFTQDLGETSLTDDYSFNHRWRFNYAARYLWGDLISKNTNFNTVVLNEFLWRTGSGNFGFEREHRTHFLAQIGWKNMTFSTGYVFRFIPLNPHVFRINHGMVFWLSIQLNARSGEKEQTFEEFPSEHIH